MSKKLCSRTECLYHDVVELILERAPATSLMRFKAVSKQWKSTIESPLFQERQYKHRQQSGDPDVLMVPVLVYGDGLTVPKDVEQISEIECLRTLVVGSSSSLQIPTPWDNTYYFVAESCCDGLVCLYFPDRSGFVVNPTTRWHRVLPLSSFNQLIIDTGKTIFFELGFGKDKFTGRYKAVWLYNSSELSLEDGTATTCEVFDFTTNAWRYVTPSAPYRIFSRDPAYVDGSLYWFTVDCPETQVISLDLHTEAFQVIPVTPFANAKPDKFNMCNLDDRLCVSSMNWPNQDIWSFNSESKTWAKIYSLDLDQTFIKFDFQVQCPVVPLALLDGDKKNKKKKKLLYFSRQDSRTLVVHDPQTKTYDAAFTADSIGFPVCYFQSLFSIK